MTNYFIRIAAFFLIPGLLVDPALANVVISQPLSESPFVQIQKHETFLFEQEALTVRARWFLHVFEGGPMLRNSLLFVGLLAAPAAFSQVWGLPQAPAGQSDDAPGAAPWQVNPELYSRYEQNFRLWLAAFNEIAPGGWAERLSRANADSRRMGDPSWVAAMGQWHGKINPLVRALALEKRSKVKQDLQRQIDTLFADFSADVLVPRGWMWDQRHPDRLFRIRGSWSIQVKDGKGTFHTFTVYSGQYVNGRNEMEKTVASQSNIEKGFIQLNDAYLDDVSSDAHTRLVRQVWVLKRELTLLFMRSGGGSLTKDQEERLQWIASLNALRPQIFTVGDTPVPDSRKEDVAAFIKDAEEQVKASKQYPTATAITYYLRYPKLLGLLNRSKNNPNDARDALRKLAEALITATPADLDDGGRYAAVSLIKKREIFMDLQQFLEFSVIWNAEDFVEHSGPTLKQVIFRLPGLLQPRYLRVAS